jgi:hypothetical protein
MIVKIFSVRMDETAVIVLEQPVSFLALRRKQ